MAFRRCPDCGAEWWNEEACLDCGAMLVDIPDDTSEDAPRNRTTGLPTPPIVVLSDPEPPRLARFLAFFVDFLVIQIAAVALAATTTDTKVRFDGDRRIEEQVAPRWALVIYCVLILVYATVTVAKWDRTPGMMATGVAVERVSADGDGRSLTWAEATIRALIAMGWFALPPLVPESVLEGSFGGVISWLSLIWPIVVFAPILIDPERRGLHDLLLRTRVVRRASPQWARNFPGMSPGRGPRDSSD